MKKVCIVYNTDKSAAVEFYLKSLSYFASKEIEVVADEDIDKADFVVVIGGDGTLLRASKKIAINKKDVVAVNLGSLGFLTDIKQEEAFDMYDKVIRGEYVVEKRKMLKVRINKDKTYYALNDVVMSKGGGFSRMLRISVFSNSEYVNTYRGDGIILSTPTGSTAYSLSAGGPIIKPGLDAMLLTPIAPHTLSMRPIVLGGNEVINFRLEDKDRKAYVMVDGQDYVGIGIYDDIEISYSDKVLRLVKPEKRDYYSVLREKLKWGEDYVKGASN